MKIDNIIIDGTLCQTDIKKMMKDIFVLFKKEKKFLSFYWYLYNSPTSKGIICFDKSIIDRLSKAINSSVAYTIFMLEERFN